MRLFNFWTLPQIALSWLYRCLPNNKVLSTFIWLQKLCRHTECSLNRYPTQHYSKVFEMQWIDTTIVQDGGIWPYWFTVRLRYCHNSILRPQISRNWHLQLMVTAKVLMFEKCRPFFVQIAAILDPKGQNFRRSGQNRSLSSYQRPCKVACLYHQMRLFHSCSRIPLPLLGPHLAWFWTLTFLSRSVTVFAT